MASNRINPLSPTGDNNGNSGDDDGSSGAKVKDYATWTYSFTPKYALIREGENKITSKIACQNGQGNTSSLSSSSNLKHYSVNVIGFDNASNTTTATSPLLPQNTSRTLSNTAVNSSDILNNDTIFVVPMPSDLLPQLNGLYGNEQGDENNDLPDTDDDADSNDDNGEGPDNSGNGKGKAKGHEKKKS